jgi:hypothetical protein
MKRPHVKSRLENFPAFEKAFFTASFWTADDEAPGGMDYRDTGNAEDHWQRLCPVAKKEMLCRLHNWQIENADLLEKAGDDEQNGHDLWLTQGGHGCGFWDRGYDKEVGEKLSESARNFGEWHCSISDEGVFIE